ncbi:MAG: HAD family phosphatase [Oscillospiraceae bacterium]|nr:HAD family phosphatase [Oscillospiraceae bacterium]
MIEKISDILLISDLDGTLFDEPYGAPCRVSEQNREAIRRFISKGGKFAIASGRPHYMAMRIMGDTAVNSLSVFANGSYLHNPETEETSCEIFVDISKEEMVAAVEEYGKVAFGVYSTNNGQYKLTERDDFGLTNTETYGDEGQEEEICEIYKYMLFARPEHIEELVAFMKDKFGDRADITGSGDVLIDIIPKGSSKARGIKNLVEYIDWDPENIVAVGDYYNDVEMLKLAGVAVAMGNAPDGVKAHADFCVKRCEEHGVADLIERLEQQYQ